MTANGCAYLVAEVCVEHPAISIVAKESEIQDSRVPERVFSDS